MSSYLENYNKMSKEEKILALQLEIDDNEYWLNYGMTNPIKIKSRKRMLKWCREELKKINQ